LMENLKKLNFTIRSPMAAWNEISKFSK
jgi:hypothetical protein